MEALIAASFDCSERDAKNGKDNQARALETLEKKTRGRLAELVATTKA